MGGEIERARGKRDESEMWKIRAENSSLACSSRSRVSQFVRCLLALWNHARGKEEFLLNLLLHPVKIIDKFYVPNRRPTLLQCNTNNNRGLGATLLLIFWATCAADDSSPDLNAQGSCEGIIIYWIEWKGVWEVFYFKDSINCTCHCD